MRRPRPARALDAVIVVAAAMSLLASTACNWVRHAPEIRGRVLDAKTGLPIEGALVERMLCREGPINLASGSRPYALVDTRVGTRTAADGTFVLPPGKAVNLSGISWAVFASGMMPAAACYWGEPQWSRRGACGSHPRFSSNRDPWTSYTTVTRKGVIELEVRLHRPNVEDITWTRPRTWTEHNPATGTHDLVKHFPEDVDAWAEYFRRLENLVSYNFLPVHTYFSEAVSFVQSPRRLSHPIVDQFVDAVLHYYQPASGAKRDQVEAILSAAHVYCQQSCGDRLQRQLDVADREVQRRSKSRLP